MEPKSFQLAEIVLPCGHPHEDAGEHVQEGHGLEYQPKQAGKTYPHVELVGESQPQKPWSAHWLHHQRPRCHLVEGDPASLAWPGEGMGSHLARQSKDEPWPQPRHREGGSLDRGPRPDRNKRDNPSSRKRDAMHS